MRERIQERRCRKGRCCAHADQHQTVEEATITLHQPREIDPDPTCPRYPPSMSAVITINGQHFRVKGNIHVKYEDLR